MTNKMHWEKLLNFDRPGATKSSNHNPDQIRSAFERDYDRIIFSHPFRKLQDKTQVFPIPEHDFVHNRLTHSLEVSSVGRSLGRAVGTRILAKYPDLQTKFSSFDFGAITAAACLAHDIGNPPFGHSGEEAISGYFRSSEAKDLFGSSLSAKELADLQNFEGNAQGFRILLNPNDQGLKLTNASMGAFTKYPHPSLLDSKIEGRKSQKKYGFFQAEESGFKELAENLGLIALNDESYCRHPLVFLVEAADDICYHIIDFEDGCRLGLLPFEVVRDFFAEILGDQFNAEKLNKIDGEDEKISVLRALVINKLISETADLFMEKEEDMLIGSFDNALVDCIKSSKTLNEISALSIKKLYRSRIVLEKEAGGYEVIEGILKACCTAMFNKFYRSELYSGKAKSVYRLLPENTLKQLDDCDSLYGRLLILCDFISGLTDRYAISLFKTMKGISLPTV